MLEAPRLNECALLKPESVVDREQAGVRPVRDIEIVDRNRRLVALRIGHRPLAQLRVLGAEHEHQPVSPDQDLPFLYRDRDEGAVLRYRNEIGVARQIDLIRQQVSQWRLRQRIKILRGKIAIAHDHRRAIRDELDRAWRVVFKSPPARLLDIEISY